MKKLYLLFFFTAAAVLSAQICPFQNTTLSDDARLEKDRIILKAGASSDNLRLSLEIAAR